MKAIGVRLNEFENATEQNVKTFNSIFTEVPLLFCTNTDIIVIGEITANSTTRELLINNVAIEHSFLRRTNSENDYNDYSIATDPIDPDWLWYFV